jgi:hypothetical protein
MNPKSQKFLIYKTRGTKHERNLADFVEAKKRDLIDPMM